MDEKIKEEEKKPNGITFVKSTIFDPIS